MSALRDIPPAERPTGSTPPAPQGARPLHRVGRGDVPGAHGGPSPLVTRRRLQVALGLLWLLDGALQFQPSMFSAQFFGMMLRMGAAEPPAWVWDLGSRLEPVLTAHAVLANAAFATLQTLVGLALVTGRLTRLALAASIPWALAVWLFGEAGGVFTPGANALTGAPGAALVYALLAVLVWPHRPDDGAAVADGGVLPRPLPELAWMALWFGTALLECESLNRMPILAGSEIANAGNGGPGWLTALNHAVGGAVGDHGALFAACAGVAQALIGVGVLSGRARRFALVAGAVLALCYGVVGQDLGGVLSNGLLVLGSGATDPGTGPVIALLAVALWPRRARLAARAERAPAPEQDRGRWSPAGSRVA